MTDTDPTTALARWFERTRFTQAEIARRLAITEGQMSHLVSGRRQPSLELAVKIAEVTGLPVADLVLSTRERA